MQVSLDWWDFEASVTGFFVHSLAAAGLTIALGHCGAMAMSAFDRRRAVSAGSPPAAGPAPARVTGSPPAASPPGPACPPVTGATAARHDEAARSRPRCRAARRVLPCAATWSIWSRDTPAYPRGTRTGRSCGRSIPRAVSTVSCGRRSMLFRLEPSHSLALTLEDRVSAIADADARNTGHAAGLG